KRYGCALTALVPAEETVDVPAVGGRKPRQLSRQLLSEIIQPRVEEIFTLVARELARAGFQDAATAGVVVTGGTSIMQGVPELAEGIFDQPVRRGDPIGVGGLADVIQSPIYSTAVGLALYGSHARSTGESGPASNATPMGRLTRLVTGFFSGIFLGGPGRGPAGAGLFGWGPFRRTEARLFRRTLRGGPDGEGSCASPALRARATGAGRQDQGDRPWRGRRQRGEPHDGGAVHGRRIHRCQHRCPGAPRLAGAPQDPAR